MTDPSALSQILGFLAFMLLAPTLTLLMLALYAAARTIKRHISARPVAAPRQQRQGRCQATTGCAYPGLIRVYLITINGLREAHACVGCHNRGVAYRHLVNANDFDRRTQEADIAAWEKEVSA